MKSIFTIYWSFVLVSIHFFYMLNVPVRDTKAYYFIVASVISLLVFSVDFKKIPILATPLLCCSLVALLKFPVAFKIVYFQSLCFTLGILIFFQFCTHEINRKLLTVTLGSLCIFESLWIIGNRYGFDLFQVIADGKVTFSSYPGSLVNQGPSSIFVAVTLPFIISKYSWPLIGLPLWAIWLVHTKGTDTPAALLTFYILVLLNFFRNKWLYRLSFAGVLATMFSHIDEMRLKGLLDVFTMPRWWQGNGFGYLYYYNRKFNTDAGGHFFGQLHNDPLELVTSIGPFAGIIFIYFLWIIWKPDNLRYWSSACALILSSFFWPVFHHAILAVTGLIILGVLLWERREQVNLTYVKIVIKRYKQRTLNALGSLRQYVRRTYILMSFFWR